MPEVIAAVLNGPTDLRLQQYASPSIGGDDALIRVNLAGVCGTDAKYFAGKLPLTYPTILGHETLGTIAEIGGRAADRYGVEVGDRVLVEATVPCWSCRSCRIGEYRFCTNKFSYGSQPIAETPPHLWGSMAEYMYVAPGSIVHPVPASVSDRAAIAAALLANGVEWLIHRGGASLGSSIVIQGCGPQGLAAAVIAKALGARRVVVTGLEHDTARLELARRLGADATITTRGGDVVEQFRELNGGELADIALNVTGSPAALTTSVRLVRPMGTVILAGLTGQGVSSSIDDAVVWNEIRIQGVFSKGEAAFGTSLALMADGLEAPVEEIVSHVYPLEQAADAIRAAAGEDVPAGFIKVAIAP
jgi:alcohol dehydrogenase